MFAVYRRELRAYFQTPAGYVFMAAFFLLASAFFMLSNVLARLSDFNNTLGSMQVIMLFVTPVLTMKLFADEKRTKTDQLLMTSPVSLTAIVVGKYLAAVTVFFVTLVISLIYPLVLIIYGSPSSAELINAYIGFFLLGSAFIAVGIFASSVTDNQVIAAIVGFALLLTFWILGWIGSAVPSEFLNSIISWLSLVQRYDESFVSGILKPDAVIYYISFAFLFIFFTIRAIEKRRWSEG